jgi:formylglycine-generating enzyme required for sulfatase activity
MGTGKFFFSYARADSEFVLKLAEDLRSNGINLWLDRLDIPGGVRWDDAVEEALHASPCLLVVLSPASVTSDNVKDEISFGLENRKTIVPVLYKDCAVPFRLRRLQYIDFRVGYDDGFKRLVQTLKPLDQPSTQQPVTSVPASEKKETEGVSPIPERALQEAASKLNPGTVFRDTLKDGSQGPEMVVIPSGTFKMGNIQGKGRDDNEKPVHTVSIAKPFVIGRYETTFEDYDRFAWATSRPIPNDEGWGRGRQPAINVSWNDAVEYAMWLSEQTGKRYRLPTEAEWEYAARAGTETEYWWGTKMRSGMANCRGGDSRWGEKQTSPVGSFQPNPFSLYDTAGNVWEWVEDCWHENYKGAPTDGSAWLEANVGDYGERVMRDGSWSNTPEFLRASFRSGVNAGYRSVSIGFRLALDVD